MQGLPGNLSLFRNKFNKLIKLEDLMVLKRSPDLLKNVKIGQDQLRFIMKHILFMGVTAIGNPNEWPWIKGHRSA